MTTKRYLYSIDIESVGPRYSDTVFSVGTCFGPADGSWPRDKLRKRRIGIRTMPNETTHTETMAGFCSNYKEIYTELITSGEVMEQKAAMTHLLAEARELVLTYEKDASQPGTIDIVTDCADFDLGRLHYLMYTTGTSMMPMRFMGLEDYHSVVDPWERLVALGKLDECEAWIQANHPGVVHDHRPDNDAEHSYYQMVYLETQVGGK